ncbi:MAG: hypothetical protein ABIY40_06495 [Rhodanobacteraceae bacterium]
MSITYKLIIDSNYFRTVIARYHRQRPFVLWLPVQFEILAAPFAGALFWGTRGSWKENVSMLALAAAGGIAGVFITKWAILKRMMGNARAGEVVTVIMSQDRISATGEHVRGEWDWAAYPRAVRFRDGILLLRRGVIRWLPDSTIQNGTPDEATDLVAGKTTLRRIN